MLIWILYFVFAAIGIVMGELLLPVTEWWHHLILVVISLWLACGIGALGDEPSDWEQDPNP
jgi:hypothetical protein